MIEEFEENSIYHARRAKTINRRLVDARRGHHYVGSPGSEFCRAEQIEQRALSRFLIRGVRFLGRARFTAFLEHVKVFLEFPIVVDQRHDGLECLPICSEYEELPGLEGCRLEDAKRSG